jgi:hypothetical protein
LDRCIEPGLEQTAEYADKLGASESHRVILNRDVAVSWDDKIGHRQEKFKTGKLAFEGVECIILASKSHPLNRLMPTTKPNPRRLTARFNSCSAIVRLTFG